MFVLEHPDGLWSRMLRPRHDHQHRTRRRGWVCGVAAATEDELTVLEDGLEGLRDEIRGRIFDGGRLSRAHSLEAPVSTPSI
jgi:hypothetical protein